MNEKRPRVSARPFHNSCTYKPNSVPSTIFTELKIYSIKMVLGSSYLSRSHITGGLKRHSSIAGDTTLHPGKDFAVSPCMLPYKLFHLAMEPQTLSSLSVSARTSTQHLFAYMQISAGRRALPATLFPAPVLIDRNFYKPKLGLGSVRTFLPVG